MKIVVAALLLFTLGLQAEAQITTPQMASPRGSVGCTIGVTQITIEYGRPSVNGRAIWGQLVPYDQIWRAGANENTVFTTSTDITVNGKPLAAGTYGLHMIPGQTSWTLIFNKDHRAWGSYFYDESKDALRVSTTPLSGPHTELLTYAVPAHSGNSATVQLQWEKLIVPITIGVDLGATVAEDLRQQLMGLPGFTARNYALAASWLLQNNTQPELAEQWLTKALQGAPDFQTTLMVARLAEAKGDTEKASFHRKQAIEMASNSELNNYGYSLLQQGKIKEALPLFVLNSERHPEDPNVWDSLGEAYAMDGQKSKAIECFKKSLSMNPAESVRQNSESWIKKLQ